LAADLALCPSPRAVSTSPMDATELARWTRFAAKGGIGKCNALCDCVAENDGDLMFLKVPSSAFILILTLFDFTLTE